MNQLKSLRTIYREASELLRAERDRQFPVGSVVFGTQFGIVANHGECPPDKLPIEFKSTNIWFKEFDGYGVIKMRDLWPAWVKRRKGKRRVKR